MSDDFIISEQEQAKIDEVNMLTEKINLLKIELDLAKADAIYAKYVIRLSNYKQRDYRKEYYIGNIDKYKNKVRICSVCDCEVKYHSWSGHLKSISHINNSKGK